MDGLEVIAVTSVEDLQEALAIRSRVFVKEQHVPLSEEVDRYDESPSASNALQLLARAGANAVGTARLLLDAPAGDAVHLGRVAVLAEWRRRGVGNALMERLHAEAAARGYSRIEISAQLHAIPFYERLGYIAGGPVYLEAGIEHRAMHLTL